jgi:septum formation protein
MGAMTPQKSFVLASKSSRRSQLLAALALEFTIDAADVDETPFPGEAPDALVCRLCQLKAAAVAERHPGEIVLAADTLVVLEGSILGKPADALEAVAMLTALRDRVHVVYTAVCVMNGRATETRVSATGVKMRDYKDAEIEAYVETDDPLDKAGAYGIQDPQFAPVEAWDGCYSAVMGLPMALAVEMLRRAGVRPSREVVETCEAITADRCCQRDGNVTDSRRPTCNQSSPAQVVS